MPCCRRVVRRPLLARGGRVAILDATNSTKARRKLIVDQAWAGARVAPLETSFGRSVGRTRDVIGAG